LIGVSPISRVHAQAPKSVGSRVTLDSATTAALLSARERIWRAWFANDSAELARLLPPAVVAAEGPDGWEDRAAIMAGSRGFAASGGKLVRIQFFDTDIVSYGNVAIVHSRFELELDNRGQRTTRSGLATELFVRRGADWVNPFWYLQ
jgi:ketosteroid isomerase-like protein